MTIQLTPLSISTHFAMRCFLFCHGNVSCDNLLTCSRVSESDTNCSGRRWYRVHVVEVIEADDDSCCVKLFYLDIGCERWLQQRHLRNIQPAFVHMPPLVKWPICLPCGGVWMIFHFRLFKSILF